MSYILALDTGIASVGHAAVSPEDYRLSGCGSHTFPAAETPKEGKSLALARRGARSQRHIISRRRRRKAAVKDLLAKHGISCAAIGGSSNCRVWTWRAEALERLLREEEFAAVLFHLAKRRGFRSGRRDGISESGEEINDKKKATAGAAALKKDLEESDYETVGAYLLSKEKQRNGAGSYENFVTRKQVKEETHFIFERQRQFGNEKATAALETAFAGDKEETEPVSGVAFFQRPLRSYADKRGRCRFFPEEYRAAKHSYSTELFLLWSRINNIKISLPGGEPEALSLEQKTLIAEAAHEVKELKFARIRKLLSLPEEARFNLSCPRKKNETEEQARLKVEKSLSAALKMPGLYALKNALHNGSDIDWRHLLTHRRDALDKAAEILSFYEEEKEIIRRLHEAGFTPEEAEKLKNITSFNKTVELSLKAINAILPHMQNDLRYDEACKEAGMHHSKRQDSEKSTKLPPFPPLRNPVVNRTLAQARKIINAYIRKYGMPERIVIEMSREMGKPRSERNEIEKRYKDNETRNETYKQKAKEIFGGEVRGGQILKLRLWEEQDGDCPYCGAYMEPEILADGSKVQIDHIIPFSKSWDDSRTNKILCHTGCNQNKGAEETPAAYFIRIGMSPDSLRAFASKPNFPKAKARRLMLEKIDEKERKSRNLNDTRYIAKEMKNHIERHLDLGKGKRVHTRNGAITAHLRRVWGFPAKNRQNDRHHALDAIVLACSTEEQMQRLSTWHRLEKHERKQQPYMHLPWESFREDAVAAVAAITCSRMPEKKGTGAAHGATIYSRRQDVDGMEHIVQRCKLSDITPAKLENMVDKERNITLYNILSERMTQHGDKAEKAFAEPIYMPRKDGTQGPRIKHIRYVTDIKSGIVVNGGLAANGDIIRTDIFGRGEKFFAVPVYMHQLAENDIPSRAITAHKPEKEWAVMREEEFLFTLYPGEFLRVELKKGEAVEGYYSGIDRSTGNITLRAHDKDPSFGKNGFTRIGIKTASKLKKYHINYFGERSLIKRETRHGLAHGNDTTAGEDKPSP